MLKRIVVKSFQGHQSKTIDLDPHVTVLVGPTDAGKSSLLRAVLWVATNQPTGDEMVAWGESRALAKLVFDDCEVVRKKGKGVNLYLLDGARRKAFGAGKVPDDVAAALRLDPINFQRQHDPHFWLSDTPGKVSQELNRIVDLSVIDRSLQAADSDLRKARAEREVCEERAAAAQKAADALAWVPQMSQDLDSINTLEAEANAAQEACLALRVLLGSLEWSSQEAQEAALEAEAALGVAEAAEAAWRAAQERDSLASLLGELAGWEEAARLEVPDLSDMEAGMARLAGLHEGIDQIGGLLEALADAESEVARWQRESTRTAEALAQIQLCPTCGQPA